MPTRMCLAVTDWSVFSTPSTAAVFPTTRSAVVPPVGAVVELVKTSIVVDAVNFTMTEIDCGVYKTVMLVPLFAVIGPATFVSGNCPVPVG